ncbi:MAG: sensor histidine kinase [Planctomycetota bacterium]
MPKTGTGKRSGQQPGATDEPPVEDLASTLESLLDASQRSAEQLSQLLDRSERVQSEIAERGAALERELGPDADTEDAVPGGDQAPGPESRDAQELEAARAVAEATDQAKSCFLAAVSRELRTPVDGLARMIELLKQTDLDAEQQRYLRTASHSVCALLSLLDSILSVSNVDAGVADLRRTDFDLRRVQEETVELLTPAARKKGLLLSCQVQPEVPTLLATRRSHRTSWAWRLRPTPISRGVAGRRAAAAWD